MTALPGLPEMYRVTWTEEHASRRGAATAAYEGPFRVRTLAVKDPALMSRRLGLFLPVLLPRPLGLFLRSKT